MRTPLAIMVVLGALLLGLWVLTEGGEEEAAPAAAPRTAPVDVIAARVEALRGLEFDRVPEPVAVTPEQAVREGLEDFDETYPPKERRADEELLKLLGLVEPDVDLRDISATTFSQGVAGYYDPRTERLRTVTGAATGTRVMAEMVLAHELTHALEDQRFDLNLEDFSGSDDAQLARLALIEGSASALMYRYVESHFTAEELIGGVLGSAFAPTGDLPAFLQAQLIFPYTRGEEFVTELLERARGRWDLVDLAARTRPPASTEQVMHPERYLEADAPERVRFDLRGVLGEGYERVDAGTLGEMQTREVLIEAGGGGSSDAAAGWGGDRYELWQPRDLEDCEAPCRRADVLVMRWVWDTPADADEFEQKLRQWVRDGLGPRADGSGVTVARAGGAVTLALAPDAQTARRAAAAR
jgi:hypothetical protein